MIDYLYIKIVRGHIPYIDNLEMAYKYSIRLINSVRYIVEYSPLNIETLYSSKKLETGKPYLEVLKKYNNHIRIFE